MQVCDLYFIKLAVIIHLNYYTRALEIVGKEAKNAKIKLGFGL